MSITISIPEKPILKPKIVVFGVGGGGCNAVNNMIHSDLEGVDFVVANTDAQSLAQNDAERCIQMGAKRTQGLGAGSHPEIGFEAAEEVIGDISDAIHGAHMVFVTAGMGGGTGTGAAPVVARLAKEMGALTVCVVTKPFMFEGNRRMAIAEAGIEEMQKYVDTLLIIPNQNLFRVSSEQTSLTEAFSMADRVLFSAVAGITNLMVRPGMINLDFADVRTVMGEMGKAMIGTGEAEGEKRGIEAAEHALNNPLLDDVSMKGARGVLISISGDENLKLYEVEEAANRIRSEVDPDAQIIFGTTTDPSLGNLLRVSVVATGIDQQDEMAISEPKDKEPENHLSSDLKIVGGTDDIPAQATPQVATPAAVNSEPLDDERSRPFQVVPKPQPQGTQRLGQAASPPSPFMASAANAEQSLPTAGLTAIAEEQGLSRDAISGNMPSEESRAEARDERTPPLSPSSSSSAEIEPPVGHLSQSAHPFESPPAASAPVMTSKTPKTPKTTSVYDNAPKGVFGRLKTWLRMTVEEESLPQRRSAISRPHLTDQGPIQQPPQQSQETGEIDPENDEQLEIPNFLKSQMN